MLARLPPGVDLWGENGKFHSFMFAGPNMTKRIKYRTGERILRNNRFFVTWCLPRLE
jgi:hypothetical protein